jgi:hypothetical protein
MKKLRPIKPIKPMKPMRPMEPMGGVDYGSKPSFAGCVMFCTSPMRCPLCGIVVPASTTHRCRS